jgi:glycosyltransferase involved in cell wall biosynthesis
VTRPWLSVIVPTYNGSDLLPAALDSLAAQADPGVEVVAVDDGSTDETPAVLAGYADRLNLTAIRRRVGNWVANTNHGLGLARGVYACVLHQDDYWLPGRLAAVRRQLAATPDVALLLTQARFVGLNGSDLGVWRCPLPGYRPLPPRLTVERLLIQNFVAVPAAVFRREAALAAGGMDEALWYTADWDLWLKLAAAGPTVYLPRPLAAFRIHPESQTAKRSRSTDDFRKQLEIVPDRYVREWEARDTKTRTAVRRAGRAATEINLALAAAYHRQPIAWGRVLAAVAALGPAEWHRLLRDSRLSERLTARLRAGFARRVWRFTPAVGSRATGP